jgi:spermidine synthase
MIPQELMGAAKVPGQDRELRCYRHDGHFTFRTGRIELMSSRVHGSEEELAERALLRLPDPGSPRVLVGGLGMGFTLARALALLGPDAVVDVVEIVPEVVTWNRELLGHLSGHPLRDARVVLQVADVAAVIRGTRAAWDAILLDVDNGPEGLTSAANDQLYGDAGLAAACAALRPGGVLAVWSAAPDRAFPVRLRRHFRLVEEIRVRARRGRGPVRTIWVAQR